MSSKRVLPWAGRLPCSGGLVLFHVWFCLALALALGCTDRDQARMGVGTAAIAACDDGNPCTADLAFCPEGPNVPPELCPNLQCFHNPYPAPPGEPHPFDDGNPCTIDTCDAVEGIRHVVAVGAACDTDGDICSGVGTCDTQGQCVLGDPAPDGTECDDGDICNGIDTCLGGGCQPPAAPAPAGINCWDGMNGCVAATCDGFGTCIQSALPGQPCDDGNACTVEDICNSAGQCAGSPVDGTSCADGDGCNGAETCQTGVCVPGTPISVDDGDPKTIDACDPATGTVHHADCSAILDLTVTTTLDIAAECLYQGPAPLQVALDGTPLPAGTFDAKRVAIVRGRVRNPAGVSLDSVTVTVPAQPGWGKTFTRSDGRFDFVVEGGAPLVVRLTKPGYLTAYRALEPAAQQYAFIHEVQLTARNPIASSVILGGGPQIAKGMVLEDQRGKRQATILFPGGTTATAVLPDGSQVPLSGAVHVRATEYTFGTNSEAAMPAPQPPSTVLTYCAELSIDEAEALGAERVELSKPVYVYLDNFLNMRVGAYVPSGYFDETDGVWKPSVADGLVVRVKDVDAGRAILSAGQDQNGADIEVPDLTAEEQEQIALLYPVGKTFWRMPITHFTTYDFNHGNGPPEGAVFPDEDLEIEADTGTDTPCPESGSIIGCENQTLGEALPITGSGLRLVYDSSRVPGRMSVLRIPIQKNTHDEAIGTIVEVSVAGHREGWVFDKDYEGVLTVAWSGHDAMGRLLQGAQPATVIVANRYRSVWGYAGAFGARGRTSIGGGGGGGSGGPGGPVSQPDWVASDPPPPIDLRRHYSVMLGHWNSVLQGLGGWSIDAHHAYDVLARTLYRGDGTRVHANTLSKIRTFAGNGSDNAYWNESMEGAKASAVPLRPERIAVGADGSVYVGMNAQTIIVRIAPDGTVHRFAGTSPQCPSPASACGDGGPALSAALGNVRDIAVGPDDSVYLADSDTKRIRRVTPDGIIDTVAGNGQSADYDASHEGMLATETPLKGPSAITVSTDGSVYFSDSHRVHRIDPSGRRWHVAGNGTGLGLGSTVSTTEESAAEVELGIVQGLAVSPEGHLLIAHHHLIGAVTPHGKYWHVAGVGPAGYGGDGGPARDAALQYPRAMAFDADGSLLFVDSQNSAVRRIEPPVVTSYTACSNNDPECQPGQTQKQLPNGRIRTIAGRQIPPGTGYGSWCPEEPGPPYLCGDGGVSTEAFLLAPRGLAIGPSRKLFVALLNNRRIAAVTPVFPGYGETTILIPSPEGSEYYLFDDKGRHIETRSALTGAVRFSFEYDPITQRLSKVRDIHGQELVITGNTIMAPGSSGDSYELNSAGYLATLKNPEDEEFVMTYHAPGPPGTTAVFGDNPSLFGEGLLKTFKTPRGVETTFGYDAWGRLTSDLDAAGGALNLDFFPSPTVTGKSFVQVTGRPTGTDVASPRPVDAYEWELLPTGDVRRKMQSATGIAFEATGTMGGSYHVDMQDGVALPLGALDVTAAPDPRFGPYAGYAKKTTVTSGGITQTIEVDRAVTMSNPDDIASATGLDETTTVAGRTWQSHFDVASRTFTAISPEGRVSTAVLDDKERVTSITLPGREPISFGYDPVHPDRVATMQIGTTTPRVTTLSYDAAGRLDSVSLPNDLAHSFGFDFDDAWRSTVMTDPMGGAVDLGRDDDGNVTTVTLPDQEVHGLDYTPVGLLKTYAPPVVLPDVPAPQTNHFYNLNRTVDYSNRPDGHMVNYEYDVKGRIQGVSFDAGALSYTYDNAGRTETATRATLDGASTLTFTYNDLIPDTIVLSGAPFGPSVATYTVDQGYDARWLLQSEDVAGKSVTYGYDDDSLLTAADTLTAVRNPQGGFIETTTIGTVGTSHAIDPGLGAPTVDAISSGGTPLMTIEYVEYDAAGRLREKVESVPGEAPVTREYVYDYRGWLTDEYQNGTLVAHFEYDGNGNRTTVALGAGAPARTGIYDDQDRLTQLGDVTYAYTENGELHQRTGIEGATTYTYDDLGVLVSVERPDLTEIRYVADPLGRRMAKLVDGQIERGWLYGDSLLPLAEVNPAGEVTARFVYLTPGAPDLIVSYDPSGAETRYRVFKDHLGSPRLLVNATTGAVVQRIEYDALGRVLSVTGTLGADAHPFGFAGGLYDPDTGLVRFGARDYDPETGRFTAKDPSLFAGGLNLYRYAENDPVNVIDPTGHSPVAILAAGFFILSVGAIMDNDAEVSTLQVLELAAAIAGMKCLLPGPKPVPKLCFAAGTPVTTEEGLVPIEEIEIGDVVWARDDKTGDEGWKRVAEVFVTPERPLLELTLQSQDGTQEVLRLTPEHPLWSLDDGEWEAAGELDLGEAVDTLHGPMHVASGVALVEPEVVYNFEVENAHTYFVGDSGVWAHNWCRGATLRGKSLAYLKRNKPKGWRTVKADHGSGWKWLDENGIERLRFMRPNGKTPVNSQYSRQANGYFRWTDEAGNYLDIDGKVVPPGPDYQWLTHIPYEGP